MGLREKKVEGEAIRAFLNSTAWLSILGPEIKRRKAGHLFAAAMNVEAHALMAKSIGGHAELVSIEEYLERKSKDADIDLTQPEEGSGPDLTQD